MKTIYKVCSNCQGKGYIEVQNFYRLITAGIPIEIVGCSACGGSGRIESEDDNSILPCYATYENISNR